MPTRVFVDSVSSTGKITDTPEASSDAPQAAPAETLRTLTAPGQEIPGISGAVVVKGDLALLSGHVPVAADGSVAPTLEGQLEQAFQNLDSMLRHAGSSLDRIARMTLYVRGYRAEQLGTIRTVRDRWLNGHAPASALIGVESLFRPDVLVEIDAIAITR
ncbi:RidA family protein [Burkholderia lata]|nr:RidA family protein [Burkholderia lata]